MSECWNCHLESFDTDFCSNCGKIQPVLDDTDYFEFLGIKELLNINQDDLEKKFYDLSKKFHPDFFQNGTREEMMISLEKSSFLNKAYHTLKDPIERAKYMLELMWGKRINEEKKNVPPEILMEVMELHEIIDRYQGEQDEEKRKEFERNVTEIQDELKKKSKAFKDKLVEIFKQWDTIVDRLNGHKLLCREHQTLLEEMNKILVVRSYLDTLLHSIDTKLAGETV